jgi:hypothetical protein
LEPRSPGDRRRAAPIAVTLNRVSKVYDAPVVSDVSLEIAGGSFVTLLGPSGHRRDHSKPSPPRNGQTIAAFRMSLSILSRPFSIPCAIIASWASSDPGTTGVSLI